MVKKIKQIYLNSTRERKQLRNPCVASYPTEHGSRTLKPSFPCHSRSICIRDNIWLSQIWLPQGTLPLSIGCSQSFAWPNIIHPENLVLFCPQWKYWKIHPIIRSLSVDIANVMMVQAFMSSRLDYCNCLLFGIVDGLMRWLQAVQNAATCLITSSSQRGHITSLLCQLHWLPVVIAFSLSWSCWSSKRCTV